MQLFLALCKTLPSASSRVFVLRFFWYSACFFFNSSISLCKAASFVSALRFASVALLIMSS